MQQEQEPVSVDYVAARWLLSSTGGVRELPIADEELEAIKETLET